MNVTQRYLIFVNLKGSRFVHAVLTPDYYKIMIKECHRAPPGIYEESEYRVYSVPFTFTTLNEFLPFSLTDIGGLKLSAECKSKKDLALSKFHQECLAVYKKFELSPAGLWFDYINDNKEYSIEFKEIYERFKQMCISTT